VHSLVKSVAGESRHAISRLSGEVPTAARRSDPCRSRPAIQPMTGARVLVTAEIVCASRKLSDLFWSKAPQWTSQDNDNQSVHNSQMLLFWPLGRTIPLAPELCDGATYQVRVITDGMAPTFPKACCRQDMISAAAASDGTGSPGITGNRRASQTLGRPEQTRHFRQSLPRPALPTACRAGPQCLLQSKRHGAPPGEK